MAGGRGILAGLSPSGPWLSAIGFAAIASGAWPRPVRQNSRFAFCHFAGAMLVSTLGFAQAKADHGCGGLHDRHRTGAPCRVAAHEGHGLSGYHDHRGHRSCGSSGPSATPPRAWGHGPEPKPTARKPLASGHRSPNTGSSSATYVWYGPCSLNTPQRLPSLGILRCNPENATSPGTIVPGLALWSARSSQVAV